MDQATELEPARIEDLLSAYRELQSQFDLVRERMRRADENKHTVPRRIYDRVRADHDRELDSIRARLTPLRDEMARLHESLDEQMRDASSAVQAVEEELAEAEFRHRIGEYEESAFADIRRTLDARVLDARSRQEALQATLSAIASMRSPESFTATATEPQELESITAIADEPETTTPASESEDTPAATEMPTATATPVTPAAPEIDPLPRRPVLSAADVAQGARPDGFENPQQWIAEMGAEVPNSERRVHLSPPVAPAPAAPAPGDELDSVLTPHEPATPSLPSLVFVSGPHAGQAIALLPTTLTIGREHDNNVEIKDPDVARYHARILRERGDYVVEDLNSSTGTWVNGERKQRTVLSHGDVIRVGQTELALDFEWTTDSR